MIGAIIGDTIGSIYEFDNIKTKDFDFWGEGIEPTDDSVLEAADFEDAIRNAVSLGGDSDTLACIAGSIAEPLFGVPQAMYKHEVNILKALFPKLQKLLVEFEKKYGNRVI